MLAQIYDTVAGSKVKKWTYCITWWQKELLLELTSSQSYSSCSKGAKDSWSNWKTNFQSNCMRIPNKLITLACHCWYWLELTDSGEIWNRSCKETHLRIRIVSLPGLGGWSHCKEIRSPLPIKNRFKICISFSARQSPRLQRHTTESHNRSLQVDSRSRHVCSRFPVVKAKHIILGYYLTSSVPKWKLCLQLQTKLLFASGQG